MLLLFAENRQLLVQAKLQAEYDREQAEYEEAKAKEKENEEKQRKLEEVCEQGRGVQTPIVVPPEYTCGLTAVSAFR